MCVNWDASGPLGEKGAQGQDSRVEVGVSGGAGRGRAAPDIEAVGCGEVREAEGIDR